MLDQDLSTPEAIFTVPQDLLAIDQSDAIGHTLDRVQGTLMVVAQLMASDVEIPRTSLRNCLLGVSGQLTELEKLVNHQPKPKKIPEGETKPN